jgi:hypothetical protein
VKHIKLFVLASLVGFRAVHAIPIDNCARPPKFAIARGISAPILSTSDRIRSGISLYNAKPDGSLGEPFQFPSWTSAGRLGAFVVNEIGDVFVIPVPNVNTLENPAEQQNWLYRIDSNSAELKVFAKLPVVKQPNQQNPYGLLGLAYDCERKLLYVSSISGSGPSEELGQIFVVRATDGNIVDTLSGIDVIGLGIASEGSKRWLYLGKARSSEIVRTALSPAGAFENKSVEQVVRIDLFDKLRARKIRAAEQGLTISTTEFYFNLIAQTEFEQPTLHYNITTGKLKRVQ